MNPYHAPYSDEKSAEGDLRFCSNQDKEKELNIQVILRCRPLIEEEKSFCTPAVVFCNELKAEVLTIQNIGNKLIDRTYVFDKVFGPSSNQMEFFIQSISPIISEVLEGFNCTIVAYGQSGTGKTYTMDGGWKKTKNGETHSGAGVIPRSVQQIFEELEDKYPEYSMKVSYIEIYNEEIMDLLADDDWEFSEDTLKTPKVLMEDGKGGVYVRGMKEMIVHSADEIYSILDRARTRRHTAGALLNKQSSCSHSSFSITVHIRQFTQEGQEVIKTGKLNIVDLAGSRNVLRSGAQEGRAREAGEINKSLLTLGRVINALVEESSHIPYRDSKLTRLLRGSLEGKIKTCIIATISPSIHCLEETLSTLDYARRAQNIKNKPKINQKFLKSIKMKDLYCEIDRLKKEASAAKEKKGICVSRNIFLQGDEEKAMAEEIERKQEELQFKDKQIIVLQEFQDSQQHFSAELNKKLDDSQKKLKRTEQLLSSQAEQYKKAKCTIRDQEYLIMKLLHSESILNGHVHCLQSELDLAVADIHRWFHKIEHKDSIEEKKKIIVQRLQSQLYILHKLVSTSVMQQESQLKEMEEGVQSFLSEKAVAAKELKGLVDKLKLFYGSRITALDCLAGEIDQKSQLTFGKVYSQALAHSSSLNDINAIEVDYLIKEFQCKLSNQTCKLNEFGKLQHEGRLKMIEAIHPISNTVTSYFHTSEALISKLSNNLEQTKNSDYRQLSDLEKKFEEFSAYEEEQLVEKLVQMLATTNVRQKKLIQTTTDFLKESVADRTSALEKEISNAENYTSLAKEQWKLFMEETENHFFKDTAEVERRKSSLDEHLNDCIQMNEMDSLLWENAHDCLLSLGNAAVESMELIVRNGLDANQQLRASLSSTATIALGNLDALKKSLHSSINGSLKFHHDACESINSIINPSLSYLRDLKTEHYNKIVQITDCIDKSLKQEYMADEPSF